MAYVSVEADEVSAHIRLAQHYLLMERRYLADRRRARRARIQMYVTTKPLGQYELFTRIKFASFPRSRCFGWTG